jgi:hypothetical protein
VSDDDAEVVLPDASRAVNLTTVVPSGKVAGASELTATCVSTRSTARAAARKAEIEAFVRGTAPSAVRVNGLGVVKRGGVVSRTVTAKDPEAVTP